MKTKRGGGLAVVTGAAGGLGKSFADNLAKRGYRLLLVDRRQQQVEEVCESVIARHGIQAEPYTADLCRREEVEGLARQLSQSTDLELLVNNAGFGCVDYFVDTDPQHVADMVDVHVVAPMVLSRAALPSMMDRNRGAIINLSSMAAWFRNAGNVHYGATKCFLAVFSMALQEELRGTNVRVQALCPGFVRTEFHAADTMKGFNGRCTPGAHMWMTPDYVVNWSLRKLASKQVVVMPGYGYSLVGRLAQMPILQPIMQWATRVPRVAPSNVPLAVDLCPATALDVAKGT